MVAPEHTADITAPSAPTRGHASSLSIWVTGASGLLGSALCRRLQGRGHRVAAHGRTGSRGFSLDSLDRIEPTVRDLRPDWIIHAAANTNLDACEADSVAAWRLHVDASREIARVASRCGCRLIYISTDSVYDGERSGPHAEHGAVRPVNHYARTKLAGEQECLETLATTIVARVNFVGVQPTRRQGLVNWLAENLQQGRVVKGFTDVLFNPLSRHDLAELLSVAVDRSLPGGIYNFGASDSCSKFEFARGLAARLGADPNLVTPALLSDASLQTPRPRNTVMYTQKLAAALQQPLPGIEDMFTRMLTP